MHGTNFARTGTWITPLTFREEYCFPSTVLMSRYGRPVGNTKQPGRESGIPEAVGP